MDSPVGRLLLRLTGVALIGVAVVALVAPRPVITPYRWPVVLAGVLVLGALAVAVRPPRRRLPWLGRGWVPPAVAAGGGLVTAAVGLTGQYAYGWDARVVMDLARTLDSGQPLPPLGVEYFSLFPNNLPLLAIDEWGHVLGRSVGATADEVLIVLGAVCVAVTLYAVHDLVVRVAGRGPALAAQLVTLALVATSPWVAVPYTDLYAMPFVVGGAALAARAIAPGRRTVRIALWLLAILSMVVAYALKTTPVVMVIAVAVAVLVAVFDGSQPFDRRAAGLAACAAGLAVFAVLAVAVPSLAQDASGADRSRLRSGVSPTPLWWLANGASEKTSAAGVTNYGTYSREMVEVIEGLTPQQMDDYARAFLADRWAERGLPGTLAFYGNKLAWNWGDGMFSAWVEGADSLPGVLPPATGATAVVQEVNGLHGRWYPLRAGLAQALWLVVLLVAGTGLLRVPYRREIVLLAVTVLGIAAFTLLFQGRARYLFAFVPIVAALAGMVHPWLPTPRPRRLQAVGGRQSGQRLR
jgi:hypothetical protein